MHRKTVAACLAVVMVAGSVGGVLAFAPSDTMAQTAGNDSTTQGNIGCDYADLFDRTAESVVSVRTDTGEGSGFVYQVNASDGAGNTSYVLTNAHVVAGAESVEIQFSRGGYRSGAVVGESGNADLAVVEVADTPGYVEALPVADEDPDRGEAVAALGNPLGFDQTITQGIVSGANRTMPTRYGFAIPNVIQTDAAISPGNSGGPLVSCDGEVVGVNTAGIASAGAENIGFAVSASIVTQVAPELVTDGEYNFSYLGVATTAVTPGVAEANDLDETRGVAVVSVADDGPANGTLEGANALTSVDGRTVPVGGDVIRSVDGQSVNNSEELATYIVTETRPGDEVGVTIVRDGTTQTVTVTVGQRPEPDLPPSAGSPSEP